MEKIVFNIDSRFRNITTHPNPEFFVIDLFETQKNIDFFRVTSIEIPIIYFIFSSTKDNDNFRIKDTSGSWVTIQIDSNYYDIDDIITEINSKILNAYGSPLFVFSKNSVNQIVITKTTPGNFYLDFTNTKIYKSLGYHLGFRKNNYTVSSGSITSESFYDMTGQNYCFLRINDYGNFHLNPGNGNKALYKIVFSYNTINFESSSDLINKTHIFRQPVNLKRLEIELLDAYGNRLDNRGIDYSLTIEMGQIFNREEYLRKLDPFSY